MAHIINQASKIIVRVHIPFLFNRLKNVKSLLYISKVETQRCPAQPRSFKEAKNIFVKKMYLIKNLKTTFPQIPNPTSFQFQLFSPSFFLCSSPSPCDCRSVFFLLTFFFSSCFYITLHH